MSEPTLAERLRKIADWITEGGEGSVREPDPGELRSIASGIGTLVDANNDQLRFENTNLRTRIGTLEAALRATTNALGDHYCGVCGCCEIDVCQPYSDVTDPETETCSGCRGNWEAYKQGREALDG